jgi:homoserine acetyltransferase
VRAARVPVRVFGCSTDTLVRPESSKRLARALDAEYVELDATGGHMWMLTDSEPFATALAG